MFSEPEDPEQAGIESRKRVLSLVRIRSTGELYTQTSMQAEESNIYGTSTVT
jgi:hypothetical protein